MGYRSVDLISKASVYNLSNCSFSSVEALTPSCQRHRKGVHIYLGIKSGDMTDFNISVSSLNLDQFNKNSLLSQKGGQSSNSYRGDWQHICSELRQSQSWDDIF